MPSSHGVIQGYNGIATVDEKHQIIVDAQAHGDGHEAKHVGEVIERVESTFRKLDSKLDIYKEVVLTADLRAPSATPPRGRPSHDGGSSSRRDRPSARCSLAVLMSVYH